MNNALRTILANTAILALMRSPECKAALCIAQTIEKLRIRRLHLVLFAPITSDLDLCRKQGDLFEAQLKPGIDAILQQVGGIGLPFDDEHAEGLGASATLHLLEWNGYDPEAPANDLWNGRLEVSPKLGRFSLNTKQTVSDLRARYA